MKKIVCAGMALLLLLTGCTVPTLTSKPTEAFTQGIYAFTFTAQQISGAASDEWEFVYTYKGETISNGHQILLSLEIFTFHSIQVAVIERGALSNIYSAAFPVVICDGGSGKTEVTVVGSDGKEATFKIACQVTQIGRQ